MTLSSMSSMIMNVGLVDLECQSPFMKSWMLFEDLGPMFGYSISASKALFILALFLLIPWAPLLCSC